MPESCWRDQGFVFCKEDGSAIHPHRFTAWFEQRGLEAGLPRIRLHDLRHSYASAALAAGIPAKVVSERLGHFSGDLLTVRHVRDVAGVAGAQVGFR